MSIIKLIGFESWLLMLGQEMWPLGFLLKITDSILPLIQKMFDFVNRSMEIKAISNFNIFLSEIEKPQDIPIGLIAGVVVAVVVVAVIVGVAFVVVRRRNR